MDADNEILTALSFLGTSEMLPNLQILETMEQFVVEIFRGNK